MAAISGSFDWECVRQRQLAGLAGAGDARAPLCPFAGSNPEKALERSL
jgi:hypothetical protein